MVIPQISFAWSRFFREGYPLKSSETRGRYRSRCRREPAPAHRKVFIRWWNSGVSHERVGARNPAIDRPFQQFWKSSTPSLAWRTSLLSRYVSPDRCRSKVSRTAPRSRLLCQYSLPFLGQPTETTAEWQAMSTGEMTNPVPAVDSILESSLNSLIITPVRYTFYSYLALSTLMFPVTISRKC